jgi:hypothetical protein
MTQRNFVNATTLTQRYGKRRQTGHIRSDESRRYAVDTVCIVDRFAGGSCQGSMTITSPRGGKVVVNAAAAPATMLEWRFRAGAPSQMRIR